MKLHHLFQGALLAAAVTTTTFHTTGQADDWKERAISPVVNPLFFEDPQINSELRPIFMQHKIHEDFITGGGNVRVYAAQLRYAVTERLAIIATKDGYVEFNPKHTLAHQGGAADLAAGLKYAVIDDRARQFILTPGVKFEFPTGNRKVFQGNGQGEWDLFVSSAKGWGDFHLTGNVGTRIPNDMDDETAQMHYSLQADYFTCRWFIPFVAVNAFTVLNDAKAIGLNVEGFDLINFGSANAGGRTQAVAGVGFRSRLHKNVDLGFAYERGVTSPRGLFDDRYTVDLIFRF